MPNAADHDYPATEVLNQWDSTKDTPRRDPPFGAYRAADLDSKLGLDVLVDTVLRALADANHPERYKPRVFVRGGKLVRVHLDEEGRPSVATLERAGLAEEIARVVHFTKELRGSIAPCHPPELVVRAVLNAREYRDIPALAGITEMPVLRADGSVLATAGYDPTTRLIYHPVPGADAIPAVADHPSDEQVARALALVWDALGEFPFESNVYKANALALLLTPVLRPSIRGQVPLALIDAPRAGTGKSLIAKVIATITVGHHRGMMTEAENDAEWRKKISATLLAGHPINIIDNVTLPLKSGALSSAISEPVWGDRQLGVMQMLSLPSRAVWIATGNNIRVGGDLPRRTYHIRLNAKKAQPWTRSGFKHIDLLAWVEQKRAHLVHALLTIAVASVQRDAPPLKAPIMGGFEEWQRVIWRAVALDQDVGYDFLGDVEASWANEDSEALEWEAFLTSWYARFADAYMTTKDIHDQVRYDKTLDRRASTALYDALPEALAEAVDRAAFGTKLGTAFNQHRDTRYGDEEYRLTRCGKDPHTHVVLWRVERGAASDEIVDTGTETAPA